MSVRALAFDVFGTVVDWRSSIIRELEQFGQRHGLQQDWPRLADEWRAGYAPAMDRVRVGIEDDNPVPPRVLSTAHGNVGAVDHIHGVLVAAAHGYLSFWSVLFVFGFALLLWGLALPLTAPEHAVSLLRDVDPRHWGPA